MCQQPGPNQKIGMMEKNGNQMEFSYSSLHMMMWNNPMPIMVTGKPQLEDESFLIVYK